MLMRWPDDPGDDGNAIVGTFLAALIGTGILALAVALVMLLR